MVETHLNLGIDASHGDINFVTDKCVIPEGDMIPNLTESHDNEKFNDRCDSDTTDNVLSEDDFDFHDSSSEEMISDNLMEDLKDVFKSINITHHDLSKILRVLQKYHPELPADARTLLSSSTEKVELKDVEPGKYFHFGLSSGVQYLIEKLNISDETIYLEFNVDGLPVHSSNTHCFWPILASIIGYSTSIFLVGAYFGDKKPLDANDYLQDLVRELQELLQQGLSAHHIKIHGFCCDTPARHFILNVKGHGSLFGCKKCEQKGETVEKRRVFTETNFQKRDNLSFRTRAQPDHHK